MEDEIEQAEKAQKEAKEAAEACHSEACWDGTDMDGRRDGRMERW